MKERRAIFVYLRGLKHLEQMKKFGDISYISKKMQYVELYVDEDQVATVVEKLNQYRFVKIVKTSPRPEIDPDLGDVHDDVFFEAYDQAQDGEASSEADQNLVVEEDKAQDNASADSTGGQA